MKTSESGPTHPEPPIPTGRFRKTLIIYNPESGRGPRLPLMIRSFLGLKPSGLERGGRDHDPHNTIRPIQAILREYGIESSLAVTSRPGEGTLLARRSVAEGYDLVIAVGGDGTVNEVVNGLAGSETVLGVIPAGTANLFGTQMNLPGDVREACRVIAAGNIRRIDLGLARDRYFICLAGIGFDAYVVKKTDTRLKKSAGAAAFAWVALRHLLFYPFRQIVMRVDDQPILRRGYLVIVGNGKYYAGDKVILPGADPADGYLDVCVFKRNNWWNLLEYWRGLSRGTLSRFLDVDYFKCERLSIREKGRHYVHVDAEYLCRTPVTIRVVPGALRVVA